MSSTYRLLTGLDSGGVRYEAGDLISTLSASVMAGLVAQGAAELVSSFPQPRIGFNGGVIEVASDGSINLTPAAGKTVTIAGVEAGIAAGGAVADGVTDNTTAINNALLDAQSRGYKAVFLPPAGNGGLYLCTGLLTIPDYMTLYG
ncbi:MAG TPA: glycosyl hydrolase family 28-related protein, partial [Chloroflexota bacterium]